MHGQTNIR